MLQSAYLLYYQKNEELISAKHKEYYQKNKDRLFMQARKKYHRLPKEKKEERLEYVKK